MTKGKQPFNLASFGICGSTVCVLGQYPIHEPNQFLSLGTNGDHLIVICLDLSGEIAWDVITGWISQHAHEVRHTSQGVDVSLQILRLSDKDPLCHKNGLSANDLWVVSKIRQLDPISPTCWNTTNNLQCFRPYHAKECDSRFSHR